MPLTYSLLKQGNVPSTALIGTIVPASVPRHLCFVPLGFISPEGIIDDVEYYKAGLSRLNCEFNPGCCSTHLFPSEVIPRPALGPAQILAFISHVEASRYSITEIADAKHPHSNQTLPQFSLDENQSTTLFAK